MRLLSPAFLRRLVCVLLVVSLLAAPAVAQDDGDGSSSEPSVGEVVFDVAVLRTLGFVQMVVGGALFCIAGPLSYPGGSWDEAWDVFVQVPYDETFTRKLGRF